MKVGDYVRTKSGKIGKILDFCKCTECEKRGFYEPILDTNEFYITNFDKECNFEGLKFSKNIIDLIEVGDYVNGFYVINKPFNQRIHTEFDDFFEEDIKSIVTKEQFESIEYKVKE